MRSGSGEPSATATVDSWLSDPAQLHDRLERWLRGVLAAEAEPKIISTELPVPNGISSHIVLFDATWGVEGVTVRRQLIARIAIPDHTPPTFPWRGVDSQFDTARTVRAESRVPVPDTYWLEPDPRPLGAPFYVMRRPAGHRPPDQPPYNTDSWVSRATTEQRARMRESSIAVLADLHGIPDPARHFSFLRDPASGRDGRGPLARQVADQYAWYQRVLAGGPDAPVIQRGFGRLAARWPEHDGEPVFTWGDARIGNIMYHDFRPVAVLNWAMATVGPRETDLGSLLYRHRFAEDLAVARGGTGLPDFLRRDDITREYREMTGHRPRDLDFHLLHAGLRHAIMLLAEQHLALRSGQTAMPADPDDLLANRLTLESMLATP